jgi:hypothetical protein
MANKKNRYKKQAKKKHFLSGINQSLKTKGNLQNTALETGKDILVGVIGGGVIGAVIGKPSLLVGLVTTGAGHYTGSKLVQVLGIGMMASHAFNKTTSVSGLEGLDGVKERVLAFRASLSDKLFLDKVLKKKGVTNGVGELQYFTYPDTSMGELAALNDIERQIEESALQFQGSEGGDEYEVGDFEDRLL